MRIFFKRDNSRVKNPEYFKKNIFIIFSPRTVTVETESCCKIDTNITLILPKKAKAFIISKYRGDDINEINGETQRLWIEILNKSYCEDLKIDKNNILGFAVVEPENLSFKNETQNSKKKEKHNTENVGKLDQKEQNKEEGFLIVMI